MFEEKTNLIGTCENVAKAIMTLVVTAVSAVAAAWLPVREEHCGN